MRRKRECAGAEVRKKQTPPEPPFVPCGAFRNGWVTVYEVSPIWKVPVSRLERCPCWTAQQEAK